MSLLLGIILGVVISTTPSTELTPAQRTERILSNGGIVSNGVVYTVSQVSTNISNPAFADYWEVASYLYALGIVKLPVDRLEVAAAVQAQMDALTAQWEAAVNGNDKAGEIAAFKALRQWQVVSDRLLMLWDRLDGKTRDWSVPPLETIEVTTTKLERVE